MSLEEDDDAPLTPVQLRAIEQLDRGQELEQLVVLLQDQAMRDFLWRVLRWGNLFGSVHDPNNAKMNVLEGRRQLALQIVAEITTASPEAWVEMQLKHHRVEQAQTLEAIRKAADRARST